MDSDNYMPTQSYHAREGSIKLRCRKGWAMMTNVIQNCHDSVTTMLFKAYTALDTKASSHMLRM